MTQAPSAEAPVPGLFARVVGMIFSPRATFERFVPHAPKVFGVIVLVGLVVGLSQGLPQLTESGRQAALDAQVQRMERMSGQPVSDQQYANMARFAPFTAYATIIGAPIFHAIFILIGTGLYFVVFNVVMGGTATFKQVMSVTAHSGVIVALGALLGAPVQYFQGTANAMGPFTLGALLPMLDEASFLARFLGLMGVFQIWSCIVTGIGFGVLYHRKAGNIVIGLLVLMAFFMAIGAFVIGMFSSR